MATITKTKSGYRAQVYVKGQRDSKVMRTKREADIWASARETELHAYLASTPGERHSLADALNKYADEVSPTKRGARWEVVRIQTFLWDQNLRCTEPIGKLTTARLAEWRDARLRSVSPGTVKREISLLSDILETARREWQWLQANPIRDMRKPSAPPSRKVTISRAQIKLMLRAMGYSPRLRISTVSQSTAMCFLVALRTGMRAGELCGLTWDRVHDGYCHLPITKTTARDVPLTDKAMRLIVRLRSWDSELVFGLQVQTLDALFRKYRKRAGLEGFTFHDTRHTAATWIVKSEKWNVLELCKAFGWSDPKQAMVYFNPTAKELADKRK